MKVSRLFLGIIIVLLGALAITLELRASPQTLNWEKETNIIPIVGEVGGGILQKTKDLEKQMGNPVIRLFINSPGGSVLTGSIFIQAMDAAKKRGSTIECVVTNMAASMGMHILAHCDKRYVLQGAFLLFHEPRVGGARSISPSEALATYLGLLASTKHLDDYLQKQIGVSAELYNFHNIAQTLWTVETFKEFAPKFKIEIIGDLLLPKEAGSTFDPVGNETFMLLEELFPLGNSPAEFPLGATW
jgi:ATP-dependent protease ClpP protease subunit